MSGLKLLITNSVLLSFRSHAIRSLTWIDTTTVNRDYLFTERGTCRARDGFFNAASFVTKAETTLCKEMEAVSKQCDLEGPERIKDITSSNWKLSLEKLLRFPLDPESKNYIRRNVPKSIFSAVKPTPLEGQTALAGISASALSLLDLHPEVANAAHYRDFASGAWIHPGSTPLAHRYGGHQFGWWAEQLGDGRAHLLGYYINRNGSWWELQLKGSGKTPYSRSGDGRAVIRSSVREFLAAEAMDALGFRTSRSASLVVGEELALRDQFYNGNLKMEKTAVVLRLAPTWFRFGSLEILAKQREIALLHLLTDHIIETHFKEISVENPDKYLSLLSKIVEETAEMIAQWQSVGFTHGVMNTDNMSLKSVTIDYGPFGFLDVYNPNFIPNSSDDEGMYSYKNQPQVGHNNLHRLANALRPILTQNQVHQLETILSGYHVHFQNAYLNLFSKKLGLNSFKKEDEYLINSLLDIMKNAGADFTMTFWELGNLSLPEIESKKIPKDFWALSKIVNEKQFQDFFEQYKLRLQEENSTDNERKAIMSTVNPRYILRNWIAQQVIEQVEEGNYDELEQVLNILQNPFSIQDIAEKKAYAKPPPKWSRTLKVSCSS